jgi:hypothetical protein
MLAGHGVGSQIRDLFASSLKNVTIWSGLQIVRPVYKGMRPEFYHGRVWKVSAVGIETNEQNLIFGPILTHCLAYFLYFALYLIVHCKMNFFMPNEIILLNKFLNMISPKANGVQECHAIHIPSTLKA